MMEAFICYSHFLQTLTMIDLGDNKIGTEGARHLASAIQMNTVRLDFFPSVLSSTIFAFMQTLTTLHLPHNKIGAKGARHIGNALQVNLVRLNFSPSNPLFTTTLTLRHSRQWILETIKLALKEHCI